MGNTEETLLPRVEQGQGQLPWQAGQILEETSRLFAKLDTCLARGTEWKPRSGFCPWKTYLSHRKVIFRDVLNNTESYSCKYIYLNLKTIEVCYYHSTTGDAGSIPGQRTKSTYCLRSQDI